MNRFTLQDLLIDAMTYGPALKYQFQSVKSYQDARLDMVHDLVANLIGTDHYDLMLRHPNMVIVFKPNTQYLAFNW
jgi:hypothetical protein